MAAASLSAVRDWASLPSPLLCSVAERLIPVAYARLHAVCSSWASAVSPEDWEEGQRQPYYLPRSLHCPWLMVPSEDDRPTGSVTFLSLPESLRPYRIPAPDLLDKRLIGSHAGWLATIDAKCNMCLINPLTRAHIPLPSISTYPFVRVVRDPSSGSPVEFHTYSDHNINLEPEQFPPEHFRDVHFHKILLSSSPSSSTDYVVVLLFDMIVTRLLFARAGDEDWTVCGAEPRLSCGYMDAVFVDQKLYAVTNDGEVRAFDFRERRPETLVVSQPICEPSVSQFKYLVFSSGDLLQVTREIDTDDEKTTEIIVDKLDLTGEQRWIRTNDLGSHSLFLGMNQSISVSVQGISGIRPNCIYFTDDNWEWCFVGGKESDRDMGVYDIKEGRWQPEENLRPPLYNENGKILCWACLVQRKCRVYLQPKDLKKHNVIHGAPFFKKCNTCNNLFTCTAEKQLHQEKDNCHTP